MKALLLLPLFSLALGCDSATDGNDGNKGKVAIQHEPPAPKPRDLSAGPKAVPGPLPGEDTEIGARVPDSDAFKAYYCGDIGFVDTGAAVDRPAYYFRREDGFVIGRCGGSCMIDMPPGRCARECPPAQWICSKEGTAFGRAPLAKARRSR